MWSRANLKNDSWFIKAVDKGVLEVYKNGSVINPVTGKELGVNPLEKAGGYHRVCILYKGKKRSIYKHRLIWVVFKGPIPEGYQVNHENGNKSKNRLSNLNLKTNSENTKHSYQTLDRGFKRGTKHVLAAFTEKQVKKIRKDYANKIYTQRELAEKYNVSQRNIFNIVHRKTYTEIT